VKPIEVFGREYFISKNGALFNGRMEKLSTAIDRYGYEYIVLRMKEGKSVKRKKLFVHRAVATLFIENPGGKPQVNHIDGNKKNNSASNLEWVSSAENQTHSRYVLGNTTGFSDTPVRCVETGKQYRSTREAWRETGVGYSHISECAAGKRKTAGGFHWEAV